MFKLLVLIFSLLISGTSHAARCDKDYSAQIANPAVLSKVSNDFYCHEIEDLLSNNLNSSAFRAGTYTIDDYERDYADSGSGTPVFRQSVVREMRAQGISLSEASELKRNFFDTGTEDKMASIKNFGDVMNSITRSVASKSAQFLVYYKDINNFDELGTANLRDGLIYNANSTAYPSCTNVPLPGTGIRRAVYVAGSEIMNMFGKVIYTISRKGDYFILKNAESGADTDIAWDANNCKISDIASREAESSLCWSCPLFRTLYNVTSIYAIALYDYLSPHALTLLIIGMAFWILWYTLQAFNVFGNPTDPMEYGFNIYKTLFRGAIAALLLGTVSSRFIYEYIVTPVMNLGLSYSKTVLDSSDSKVDLSNCQAAQVQEPEMFKNKDVENGEKYEQAFSEEAKNELTCLIENVSKIQARYITVSRYLIQYSFNPVYARGLFNPNMLLSGIVMFLIFAAVLISFPLILLSHLFNLSLLCLVTPFLVVAWVFEGTEHYVNTAFDTLIESILGIVFLSVIASYIVVGMRTLYTPAEERNKMSLYITDTSGKYSFEEAKGIDPLEEAVVADDVEAIIKNIHLGGINWAKLLLLGFVFLTMIYKVNDIAKAFSQKLSLNMKEVADSVVNSSLGKLKSFSIQTIKRVNK